MSETILTQIIEYDHSAAAWGQYENDGNIVTLVKYHDSERDATLAALPPELRLWVEQHPGETGRVLRAAVLIADNRIIADAEAYGIYHTRYTHKTNDVTYSGSHSANVHDSLCTCEDYQYKRQTCKHLYAAEKLFNDWRAQHLPDRRSLWDLAQEAVRENRNNIDIMGRLTIWTNGNHTAWIQVNHNPFASERGDHGVHLVLGVTGSTFLTIATRFENQLATSPENAYRWEWTVRQDDYNAWSRELQATKGEQTK